MEETQEQQDSQKIFRREIGSRKCHLVNPDNEAAYCNSRVDLSWREDDYLVEQYIGIQAAAEGQVRSNGKWEICLRCLQAYKSKQEKWLPVDEWKETKRRRDAYIGRKSAIGLPNIVCPNCGDGLRWYMEGRYFKCFTCGRRWNVDPDTGRIYQR